MMRLPIVVTPSNIGPPGTNKPGPKPLGRRAKYPFKKLKVGQSFLIPEKFRDRVAPLAAYYKAKYGLVFAVVRLEHDPERVAVCRIQ